METCMFLCFYVQMYMKHKNMHVFMYFLHLVPPFTPHYIIMVIDLLTPHTLVQPSLSSESRANRHPQERR